MDKLTFISNLIRDMAWPLSLLAALAIILWKGSRFAEILKSFKFKELEVTFRDDFRAAKVAADQILIREDSKQKGESNVEPGILHLAEIDTPSAIVKVWQKLEAKLIEIIRHNGLIRFTNPSKFVDQLHELGKITKEHVELYNRLKKIRNDVLHMPQYGVEIKPSIAEVLEYDALVETFNQRLEEIMSEDGYIDLEIPKKIKDSV